MKSYQLVLTFSYRFFKLSALSSARPLPLPRSKQRATQVYQQEQNNNNRIKETTIQTSSLQSKKSTHWILTFPSMACFHPSTLSLFRGKPSIKKFSLPLFCIAYTKIPKRNSMIFDRIFTFSRSLQVTATGTIVPFLICSLISLPKAESGLAASSRRRSPADK